MAPLIPEWLAPYLSVHSLGKERDLEKLEHGEGCYSEYHGTENFLYHNGPGMHFLAYLEFSPGVWRGNHRHEQKVEHLCVLKGSLIGWFALPGNMAQTASYTFRKGQVINLNPGVAHAFMSPEGAAAVEFSPQTFSQTDHIPTTLTPL